MALMMIPLVYLGIGAVSALGAGVGTALGFATGLQIRRWLPKSPPGEQHSTATVPLVHACARACADAAVPDREA